MYAPQAHPGFEAPSRLLKWHTLLDRLQPWRVRFAEFKFFSDLVCLYKTYSLIQEYAPALFEKEVERGIDPLDEWTHIYNRFLNHLFHEGKLDPATDLLNFLYEGYMEVGEDYMEDMAIFLDYIPVQQYGYHMEDAGWDFICYRYLAALFLDRSSECYIGAQPDDRIVLEWYDTPEEVLREIAQDAYERIAWDLEPEPYCWIPTVVDVICAQTGNHLLDNPGPEHSYIWDGETYARFTWEQLDAVASLTKEAKGVQEILDKFLDQTLVSRDGYVYLDEFQPEVLDRLNRYFFGEEDDEENN